ncbi:PIN domain nuclease [Mycobacterium sp. M1]|uniref:Ribonuclease VapC n=1 Tax=Mycolicibacter acidiphilus TaxID=2835306 RepID=A0ABS5RH79_9MYCO|nr:PIN domain nuclease [Mycolicibacter acidiphilus]MBS9533662.1 PIN domain nuclease [Mycolicibacter acidiphilus]
MSEQQWLIDKSALIRIPVCTDPQLWLNRIARGLVRITTVTRLEIGFSCQTGDIARRELREPPVSLMPVEHLQPRIEDRVVEVQALLADRGQHRAPSIPDLILAATAELTGLTILHVDNDFDLITAITGQPTERLQLA